MRHLLTGIFIVFAQMASAVEFYSITDHPSIKKPVMLDDVVLVQISPRGQKIFAENMLQVLSNVGVVINENYFPKFEYISPEAINIDELAKKNPAQFAMIKKTRDFFKQYVKGLELKDFKPAVRIGPSEYVAEFDKLSLVADEALMKQLGKTDGAVLAIEMKIRKFQANSDSVHIQDLANKWLGEVGVTNPSVIIGTKETPLTARMPFYVKVTEQGELKFETLKLEENLDSVPVEVRYQKLLLPEFEFKVVGQKETYKVSLDEKGFKKLVDEQLPTGIKMIRDYARHYLQNEFPKTLNQKAQEALKGELEQLQVLPAAGHKENDTRPPLSLGMKLKSLNLQDSFLKFGISAFIEDTSLTEQAPLWKNSGARDVPSFTHLKPEDYDLALAVDRKLFNRMIHLSFNRKNFKALETCPGTPAIELVNAPAIDFTPKGDTTKPLETTISLYINALINTPDEHKSGLLAPLKDKLHLSFTYKAVVKPIAPGSAKLGIYPAGVDVQSLVVYEDSLTWVGKLAQNKVVKEVAEALSEGASCGSNSSPTSLGEFALIDSLWGVPVEFVKIQMDPQGQLMLYMDFKKDGLK